MHLPSDSNDTSSRTPHSLRLPASASTDRLVLSAHDTVRRNRRLRLCPCKVTFRFYPRCIQPDPHKQSPSRAGTSLWWGFFHEPLYQRHFRIPFLSPLPLRITLPVFRPICIAQPGLRFDPAPTDSPAPLKSSLFTLRCPSSLRRTNDLAGFTQLHAALSASPRSLWLCPKYARSCTPHYPNTKKTNTKPTFCIGQ